MPAPRDRAALIKAARMYFLDGRSQDDVARALGTSRSNVSRMLTAARAQGIVEIRVHDQTSRAAELEQALREQFGLRARTGGRLPAGRGLRRPRPATWPPSGSTSRCATARCWGLSWGTSLQAMVDAFSVDQPRERGGRAAGRRSVDRGVPGRRARSWCGSWPAGWARPTATCTRPALLRSETARDCVAGRAGDRRGPGDAPGRPTSRWSGSARSAPGRATQSSTGSGSTAAERRGLPRRRPGRRHLLPVLRRRGQADPRGRRTTGCSRSSSTSSAGSRR